MYLAVKQQLNNLSKDEYLVLRELCHVSKNLYNQALYEIRQEYFRSKKYLNYLIYVRDYREQKTIVFYKHRYLSRHLKLLIGGLRVSLV